MSQSADRAEADLAAEHIGQAWKPLRQRARVLANGYCLWRGMNDAMGPHPRQNDKFTRLLKMQQEQNAFLSIVVCSSLLDSKSEWSFQAINKKISIHGIEDALVKRDSNACPTESTSRFGRFYASIDWKVHGRMMHFRNMGIAHLTESPATKSITYLELGDLVRVVCNLSRETAMMACGLSNDPLEDAEDAGTDAASAWRLILDQISN